MIGIFAKLGASSGTIKLTLEDKHMGYIVTIILLIGWVISDGTADTALIAAGLFAIAGAISFHR